MAELCAKETCCTSAPPPPRLEGECELLEYWIICCLARRCALRPALRVIGFQAHRSNCSTKAAIVSRRNPIAWAFVLKGHPLRKHTAERLLPKPFRLARFRLQLEGCRSSCLWNNKPPAAMRRLPT